MEVGLDDLDYILEATPSKSIGIRPIQPVSKHVLKFVSLTLRQQTPRRDNDPI